MTGADLDVRPVGWCYRCDEEHDGDASCWAYVLPRTAGSVAWSAYCRALDDFADCGRPSEASPEVLDALAYWAADQAKRNRERRVRGESG